VRLFLLLSPGAACIASAAGGEQQVCDVGADYALGIEDYSEAIRLHTSVLRKQPENALAHYHLGFAEGMMGGRTAELSEYQRAAALGLRNWDLFLNIGLAQLENGELDAATDSLRQAVLLGGNHSEPHFNLALFYERRGLFADAERETLAALQLNPGQPDAWNSLGVIYAEEGKTVCASVVWRELVRTVPDYQPARRNLELLGSQLEQTRLRVSLAVGENRILTVLTRAHECHYRNLLKEVPPENLVIQPENRGTAPAILYALLRLSDVARDAYVAVFPSDHFVSDDREFMRHVDLAFDAIGLRPEMIVLLGITPHAAESGYGWIEPGELVAARAPLFRVLRFWEKPANEIARELLRAGCLWNSFVMVARVSTLIGLIMVAMPELLTSFSKIHDLLGTAREPSGLERLYKRIPTASFSDEVLERYPINLGVLPVHGIEWSDLGEPQRVRAVLSRLGVHPESEVA
jgi:mannose-1-phosphate guanylyltransferase